MDNKFKSSQAKRFCVFAHYDPHSIIDDYVVNYLENLKQVSDSIILVSVCSLSNKEKFKVKNIVEKVIIRENIGYDFCSWKDGISYIDSINVKDDYELILANDSCYGPLFSMGRMFEEMGSSYDFWGVADCTLVKSYLQSYFMVFSSNVVASSSFKDFWEKVVPVITKHEVVVRFEEQLTYTLNNEGFNYGVFMKMKKWDNFIHSCRYKFLKVKAAFNKSARRFDRNKFVAINEEATLSTFNKVKIGWQKIFRLILPFHSNVYLTSPVYLISKRKNPLIKTMLFKNNPMRINIDNVFELIDKHSGYDVNLIKAHIERVNK